MKKTPLVSVIIPVYNEERYIRFCLDSLMNQTYKNKDIIIIDDGSSDNSLKIIKTYPVKLIRQDHKGAGAARNNGAKHARGEILIFPDADMRYDKYYIEKLIAPILKTNAVGTFNEERIANPENIFSKCWSINSDLEPGQRTPKKIPDKIEVFRAIQKKYFLSTSGFDFSQGYHDDGSISKELQKKSIIAPGAIAYHYNPETLSEVFYSARWIGRSPVFPPTLFNLLRFSLPNSIRLSILKVIKGAPLAFIPFKIVYDSGMFCGVFLSFGKVSK